METSELLAQRQETYGEFIENAKIAQQLKQILHSHPNWRWCAADEKEAADVICSKISRWLSFPQGRYIDNWDDIAGYAKLVADRMRREQDGE